MARFRSQECSVPVPSPGDVDALPLGAMERGEAIGWLPWVASNTDRACRTVRGIAPPWRARAERAGVLVRAGDRVMLLEARLQTESGTLCVGPLKASWLDR
jgi:hypothetical protein